MERPIRTQIIRKDDKELLVASVNLHDKHAIATLPTTVARIFEELAPYAKNRRHVAYVRDFPTRASRRHPGGFARNDREMDVWLADWPADRKGIVDTFAEELHHLVRYQHVGYPKTLGEELALEATARAYAERKSGLRPPWTHGSVSQQVMDQALVAWNKRKDYSSDAWFQKGPHGKWVGYKLAYRLARRFFAEGFDLERSLTTPASDFKRFLS